MFSSRTSTTSPSTGPRRGLRETSVVSTPKPQRNCVIPTPITPPHKNTPPTRRPPHPHDQERKGNVQANIDTLEKELRDLLASSEQQTKQDYSEQINKVAVDLTNTNQFIHQVEAKVKELEGQLDEEQRRLVENQKNFRRTERRTKELSFQQEEDAKNRERMQELVDKLQQKVKSYKKQIEEAEEIAALNLAKFRKAQQELEQSEGRADLNEQVLAKCRVRGRSMSQGPVA